MNVFGETAVLPCSSLLTDAAAKITPLSNDLDVTPFIYHWLISTSTIIPTQILSPANDKNVRHNQCIYAINHSLSSVATSFVLWVVWFMCQSQSDPDWLIMLSEFLSSVHITSAVFKQVSTRPGGRCDTRSSRIISDKCHKNKAFPLMKCI